MFQKHIEPPYKEQNTEDHNLNYHYCKNLKISYKAMYIITKLLEEYTASILKLFTLLEVQDC